MAVESKIMKRWEFESASQASEFIRSWFKGSKTECRLLRNYLNCISSKGKSMNYYPSLLYGSYTHITYMFIVQVMMSFMMLRTS